MLSFREKGLLIIFLSLLFFSGTQFQLSFFNPDDATNDQDNLGSGHLIPNHELSTVAINDDFASNFPITIDQSSSNASEIVSITFSHLQITFVGTKIFFTLNITVVGIPITNNQGPWILDFAIHPIDTSSVTFQSDNSAIKFAVNSFSFNNQNLRIIFEEAIGLGSLVEIGFKGELIATLQSQNNVIRIQYVIPFNAGLFSVSTVMPNSIILLGLNPSAHQNNQLQNSNRFAWNFANQKEFQVNITYSFFDPDEILALEIEKFDSEIGEGESLIVSIELENKIQIDLRVTITVPKWFEIIINNENTHSSIQEVNLSGNKKTQVTLQSHKNLTSGSYNGILYFIYQESIWKQTSVNFTVTESGLLPFIILLISSIALIGLGINFVYTKVKSNSTNSQQDNLTNDTKVIDSDSDNRIIGNREKEVSEVQETRPLVVPSKSIKSKIDFSLIARFLGEDELAIIEFLDKNPGSTQQELVNMFGLSKATVSRRIKKLEGKGFIRKDVVGMSNNLYLNYDNFK